MRVLWWNKDDVMLFVVLSVSVWYLTAAIEEPMLQYVAMSVSA